MIWHNYKTILSDNLEGIYYTLDEDIIEILHLNIKVVNHDVYLEWLVRDKNGRIVHPTPNGEHEGIILGKKLNTEYIVLAKGKRITKFDDDKDFKGIITAGGFETLEWIYALRTNTNSSLEDETYLTKILRDVKYSIFANKMKEANVSFIILKRKLWEG